MAWKCPDCGRSFTRENQRHRCGTGDITSILKDRPEELVAIFGELKAFTESLGDIEIVARDRYALFRTTRIFTDLSVMKDCIRIVIHLPNPSPKAFFIKIVSDRKQHSHVAKLYSLADLQKVKRYLAAAYAFSHQTDS